MRTKPIQQRSPQSNHHHPIPDEPPPGFDHRVARILRQAECPYDLLDDGTFIVRVDLPNERSHNVLVQAKTNHVGEREMRRVFSAAFASEDPLPGVLANRLLLDNSLYRVAAWQVVNTGDTYVALLSAFVPADAGSKELLGAIGDVARAANRVEEDLTGGDCF